MRRIISVLVLALTTSVVLGPYAPGNAQTTSSPGYAAAAPGEVSQPGPALRVRGTALRVRVTRPTRQARGKVVVRGPRGYRRTITKTSTLRVAPGRYVVRAQRAGGRWGSAYPDRRKQRVRVRPGRRTTARVRYSTLVAPGVTVVRARDVLGVSGDAARRSIAPQDEWALSGGVGPAHRSATQRDSVVRMRRAAPRYGRGDVLVLGVTQDAPAGLMARVVAVSRSRTSSRYVVRPVPLSEVVLAGRARTSVALEPGEMRFRQSDDVPGTARRATTCGTSGSGVFKVDFGRDVSVLDVDIALDAKDPGASHVRLATRGTVSGSVSATASGGLACTERKQLWATSFKPYTVMVGPVPVVFRPQFEVNVEGSVSASTGFTTSATFSRDAESWIEASGRGLDWGRTLGDPQSSVTPAAVVQPIKIDARITPRASLVFYGLVGPYLELSAGPSFVSDPRAETWLTTTVGMSVGLGVAVSCVEVWGPDVCPNIKASVNESFSWDALALSRPRLAPIAGGIVATPWRAPLRTVDGRRGHWELVGDRPGWLRLDEDTLVGTPPAEGRTTVRVGFVDAEPALAALPLMNREFEVHIDVAAGERPVVATDTLPGAEVSVPYDEKLSTVDGRLGTWEVTSGALPDGLSLVGARVTGTPVTPGVADFVVTFTDVAGRRASQALAIEVVPRTPPSITTAELPDGEVNLAYRVALATADGRPGEWSVTGGALPDGLALSADGVIAGYPAAAGDGEVTIAFTDDESGRVAQRSFSLVVAPDQSTVRSIDLANGLSEAEEAALSADGRFVAYSAARPEGSSPCACTDVWLWDSRDGTSRLISSTPDGGLTDGDSRRPAVDASGNTVTFVSEARDLTDDSPAQGWALYRWDRASDTVVLVRVLLGTASSSRSLTSADGSLVFFEDGEEYETDIWMWSATTGMTTNLTPEPTPYGFHHLMDLSSDGRYVAISSEGVEAPSKVRVIDSSTGAVMAPPRDSGQQDEDDDQTSIVLSPSGRLAVFAWYDTWRHVPSGKTQFLREWHPLGDFEETVPGSALSRGLFPVDVSDAGDVVLHSLWDAPPAPRLDNIHTGSSRLLGPDGYVLAMSEDGATVLMGDGGPRDDATLRAGDLSLWAAAP